MTDSKEKLDITESIGNATKVVFSFDTTGSMGPAIEDVRKKMQESISEMFKNIPGLEVGLISHGDYCDGPNCINILQLTTEQSAVEEFIRNAPPTSGGDSDECYELVLKTARILGWENDNTPGKVFVIIGDAAPHGINYTENKEKLDWKEELLKLLGMNVKVYALQCLYNKNRQNENTFWEELSKISRTPLLKLDTFGDAANTLSAIAHTAAGPEVYATYRSMRDESVAKGSISTSCAFDARLDSLASELHKFDRKEGKKDESS